VKTDLPVVVVGMTIPDGMAQQINAAMAELAAWRVAHKGGAAFIAAVKDEAPMLAIAVGAYRQAIEQVLVESGFPSPAGEPS
jgi:hypothetical protein